MSLRNWGRLAMVKQFWILLQIGRNRNYSLRKTYLEKYGIYENPVWSAQIRIIALRTRFHSRN